MTKDLVGFQFFVLAGGIAETYKGPSQSSMMEVYFTKIVNG